MEGMQRGNDEPFLRRSLCLRTDVVRQLAGPGRTYPERYRRFTGGSLDRSQTLEFEFPDILYDWKQNNFIQDWARERAALNIRKSTNKQQRHPYEPCYLYESGIQPLEKFPIRGIIWYQGESNAHNMEAHEKLFHLLTKTGGRTGGRIAFLLCATIQHRPSQLALVPGQPAPDAPIDPQQRHGGQQRPWRLPGCPPAPQTGDRGTPRSLALNKTYGHEILPSGPLYRSVIFKDSTAYVTFDYGKGMHSSDGDKLRTFEIAEHDGLFVPAEAQIIDGKTVKVWSGQIRNPKFRPLRLATFHPCQFSERSGAAGFDILFGSGSGQLVPVARSAWLGWQAGSRSLRSVYRCQ